MTSKRVLCIIVLGSLVLSTLGVAAGVFIDSSHGGRGGAVAVALSFAAIFIGRNFGTRVYDILTKDAKELEEDISSLRANAGAKPAPEVPQQRSEKTKSTEDKLKSAEEKLRALSDRPKAVPKADAAEVNAGIGEGAETTPEGKLAALTARISFDSRNQTSQNIALAAASVIGTIAWGFGDLAALCISRFAVVQEWKIVVEPYLIWLGLKS